MKEYIIEKLGDGWHIVAYDDYFPGGEKELGPFETKEEANKELKEFFIYNGYSIAAHKFID